MTFSSVLSDIGILVSITVAVVSLVTYILDKRPTVKRLAQVSAAIGIVLVCVFALAEGIPYLLNKHRFPQPQSTTTGITPNSTNITQAGGTTSSPITPTPSSPRAGTVLYQANWSNGTDGWTTPDPWSIQNGILANNGASNFSNTAILISPPFQPVATNYRVDTRIRFIPQENFGGYGFGVILRSQTGNEGYMCVVDDQGFARIALVPNAANDAGLTISSRTETTLADRRYSVDTSWHTYTVEARGSQITCSIDGQPLVQVTDQRYLTGGVVGLVDAGAMINVSSFKVTAL